MNCLQHPERTATAFCQNCGKALCPECVRHADGLVLCEPCLLIRYPSASAASAPGAGWTPVPGVAAGSAASQAPNLAPGYAPGHESPGAYGPAGMSPVPPPDRAANPALAGAIGWIPGVGAMYNGQFVKALIHVVVFVVLIGISEHFGPAGILIAAWVIYQVFDAVQTAAARRDGRPLPDPLGIQEWSRRIGPQGTYPGPAAYPPYAAPRGVSMPPPATAGNRDPRWAPYQAAPTPPVATPFAPVPVPLSAAVRSRRGEPVGAIVLIAVGLLLLMSTLGVLNVDWIGRGWPVLILLLGIWLLVRRVKQPAPGMIVPGPPPAPKGNPLSIAPDPAPGPDPNPAPEWSETGPAATGIDTTETGDSATNVGGSGVGGSGVGGSGVGGSGVGGTNKEDGR